MSKIYFCVFVHTYTIFTPKIHIYTPKNIFYFSNQSLPRAPPRQSLTQFLYSMHTKILLSPTANLPLVLVTSNTSSYVTLTKYFLRFHKAGFHQTLHTSRCRIKKREPLKTCAPDNLHMDQLVWSPETVIDASQDNIRGIFCLDYNPTGQPTKTLNICAIGTLNNNNLTHEIIQDLLISVNTYKESLNQSQTKPVTGILQNLLTNAPPDKITPDKITPDKITPDKITPEQVLQIKEHLNYFYTNTDSKPSENNLASFPTTILQALETCDAQLLKPSQLQNFQPPTPIYCGTQPTIAQPFDIFLTTPTCHHHSLPAHQPSATYRVYIQDNPETTTKLSRQLCMAVPLEPSPKNPNCQPFPLCPVKSSIALLFYDSNPSSPTCGQPIVKSINTHQSGKNELKEFLSANQPYLSPFQHLLLSPPLASNPPAAKPVISSFPQPNPPKEPTMSDQICKFCGASFRATGTRTIYCSPRCRIDYNAGKKFEELGLKKLRPAKHCAAVGDCIQFSDGSYYSGATYTKEGHPVHSIDNRSTYYHAKIYSPAKIQELFGKYPEIFANCVMATRPEFD